MRHTIWLVSIMAGALALGVLTVARQEGAPRWVRRRLFAVVALFAVVIAIVAPYGA